MNAKLKRGTGASAALALIGHDPRLRAFTRERLRALERGAGGIVAAAKVLRASPQAFETLAALLESRDRFGYAGATVALALIDRDARLREFARERLRELGHQHKGIVAAARALGVSPDSLQTLAARLKVTLPDARKRAKPPEA